MSASVTELREAVCRATQELAASGLVMGTFGNVSGADRGAGVLVIKPSGVPYDRLTPEGMVTVSLATGEVVDGDLRPSSDTPTHLELYRAFGCGGVAHTHSEVATAFAQARLPIRCLGTTHADHFRGDVPVTRPLTRAEVERELLFPQAPVLMTRNVLVARAGTLPAWTGCRPADWGRVPRVGLVRGYEYAGDVDALVRAILALAQNPEQRGRLGAAGYAGVRARYGAAQMVARVTEVYRSLLVS